MRKYAVRGNSHSGYFVDVLLPNGDRILGARKFKFREDAIDFRNHLIDKNSELDKIKSEDYYISDEEFRQIEKNADEVFQELDPAHDMTKSDFEALAKAVVSVSDDINGISYTVFLDENYLPIGSDRDAEYSFIASSEEEAIHDAYTAFMQNE